MVKRGVATYFDLLNKLVPDDKSHKLKREYHQQFFEGKKNTHTTHLSLLPQVNMVFRIILEGLKQQYYCLLW